MKITELDLEFVKRYLRVEHIEDDVLIGMMLTASKSFIQSYLNRKFVDMQALGEEIPDEFTIPCLALIAHWYEKRQITPDGAAQEILYTFSGILDMHRIFIGGELI